ncbi:MAG: Glucose-1-phosphate thymidylyltransferase (EC [uncultured Thiotrichaceae bacterium]|uniref:Glucose-1-phosphate thymidylyltransferase (EC) n=1 Tax=uncultured Thiotrichaceae bacterium TaxID=298394 RepID=A0A6S6T8L7_9GAMM|nr:MAG: Glucose-1-phosphate thymidylyltransferase (EC [uncultured Thiotrichaceae bacterium]
MKAMILAAGHGKRMRPLTDNLPKPLLEVAGKPLILWHIERLKRSGITDFVINIAWKGWKIPERLGDGSAYGVKISYSDEQDIGALETAGGIIKALPLLEDQPFLVVNGDIWCDYPYSELTLDDNDLAHLILVDNPAHNPSGDFHLENGRSFSEGDNKLTFSGIGLYSPKLFSSLPVEKTPLAPLLFKAMDNGLVSAIHFTGDWRDIGTPKRLKNLEKDIKN